jgi:hypothetical protein
MLNDPVSIVQKFVNKKEEIQHHLLKYVYWYFYAGMFNVPFIEHSFPAKFNYRCQHNCLQSDDFDKIIERFTIELE